MNQELLENLRRAVSALKRANSLLITAGAGMGVDSGLPDFRGQDGFWNAYPLYRKLGLDFSSIARPKWFIEDPHMAWGFYGHRFNLYRDTKPHQGFQVLKSLASKISNHFVYTSNIDGHFHKAGFDESLIVECHGTIRRFQCFQGCGLVFSSENFEIHVDKKMMRAIEPLPSCPNCGNLARPNVLMFWDFCWDHRSSSLAEKKINYWLDDLEKRKEKTVIIELGAGTEIPTIREFSESVQSRLKGTLIRINKRDAGGPEGTISFYEGANYILGLIDEMMA